MPQEAQEISTFDELNLVPQSQEVEVVTKEAEMIEESEKT